MWAVVWLCQHKEQTYRDTAPILHNWTVHVPSLPFWEKSMQETLHDHHTFISIGGRPYIIYATYDLLMTSILWAAAMNFKTSSTDRAMAYGMEVSTTAWTTSVQKLEEHEQHRAEVRGGDQFQVPGSNPAQRWHLLSRRAHQDCLSNGQTKHDLAVQHSSINLASKFKLYNYKSLVTSILLNSCKT